MSGVPPRGRAGRAAAPPHWALFAGGGPTSLTSLPPSQQVTRDTFPAALASLRAALAGGAFAALDLEMTGTSPPPAAGIPPPARCDDPPDRWPALASAAASYLVLQVGVAVFAWDAASASYVARTFNFTIFPYTPPEVAAGAAAAANGEAGHAAPAAQATTTAAAAAAPPPPLPPAPPFLASPSALTFLSGCGFDFNKWVAQGIPYVPAAVRDAAAGRAEGAAARARERPPIVPTRPADVALVKDTAAAVEAWLAGDASASPPLTLPPVNGFQRALIYETLDALNGGAWSGGERAGAARPAQFVAETVRPPGAHRRAPAAIRLTRVGGADEAAAHAAARESAAGDALSGAAGAAAVLEALRDARLPVAVHNGALDLALTLTHLGDGHPVPGTWEGFARRVGAWLPGGVLDTKVLAGVVLGPDANSSAGTALRAVYDACRGANTVKEATGTAAPSPWAPSPPPVRHAPGFDRYASDSSTHEHEAGFDAFMTGACLVGCGAALEAARVQAEAAASAEAAAGCPRALVAALERAPRPASAAGGGGGASPIDLAPLLAAHGGHCFAFASDRGVLALGGGVGPATPPLPPLTPPSARDHLLYVAPCPPALGWSGLGRTVGEVVVGLREGEGGSGRAPAAAGTPSPPPPPPPRVRVLPRAGGAAAAVEVSDLLNTTTTTPPLPPPPAPPGPPPPWGGPVMMEDAPSPPQSSVKERAAALAAALAAHPALAGCRVLTHAGWEAWVSEAGGWDGAAAAAAAARDALVTVGGGDGGAAGAAPRPPPSPVRAAGRLAERWAAGVRARKRARGAGGEEDGGGGGAGGRQQQQQQGERCAVM